MHFKTLIDCLNDMQRRTLVYQNERIVTQMFRLIHLLPENLMEINPKVFTKQLKSNIWLHIPHKPSSQLI